MNISIELKKILSLVFHSTGYLKNRIEKDKFIVLMYHRILPSEIANTESVQSGMYVDPKTFKKHIKFLKDNFNIEKFSNHSSVRVKRSKNNSKPVCYISFDDGWCDFFGYAYPILKEHNVPATVFLPTNYIGTKKEFWTEELIRLLKNLQIHSNGKVKKKNTKKIIKFHGALESRIENAIELLKGYREDEINSILSQLASICKVSDIHDKRVFLSWSEVREMAQSDLISFGSHTSNHLILTNYDNNVVQNELIQSRKKLIEEGVVDPAFIPFCYPNGNHNQIIAEMVKDAGYHLAVTTKFGWNQYHADPYTLNRIGIHQDITSTESMYGSRILGLF